MFSGFKFNILAYSFLKLLHSGSGYNLNLSKSRSKIAFLTLLDGGYGFSLVFNFIYTPSFGCSPGTYGKILFAFLGFAIYNK